MMRYVLPILLLLAGQAVAADHDEAIADAKDTMKRRLAGVCWTLSREAIGQAAAEDEREEWLDETTANYRIFDRLDQQLTAAWLNDNDPALAKVIADVRSSEAAAMYQARLAVLANQERMDISEPTIARLVAWYNLAEKTGVRSLRVDDDATTESVIEDILAGRIHGSKDADAKFGVDEPWPLAPTAELSEGQLATYQQIAPVLERLLNDPRWTEEGERDDIMAAPLTHGEDAIDLVRQSWSLERALQEAEPGHPVADGPYAELTLAAMLTTDAAFQEWWAAYRAYQKKGSSAVGRQVAVGRQLRAMARQHWTAAVAGRSVEDPDR